MYIIELKVLFALAIILGIADLIKDIKKMVPSQKKVPSFELIDQI